ncbi:hypothetical protein ACOT81_17530 [Streptomyces sp. WI04-05B]|uniref:hypothetical protein n=1 Tax=Streptomyces TaxID=1883 RepID=UPI0029BDEB22|nr:MULTISPECIES: hypothetical protein [unclassified Streptomyces]MDX2543736.1 hypothetical protein [Streptomyces sp. WI04-05B]MDX2582174.1 hypothetical protein [Streptomyces sp. WI04-05A]
MTEITGNGTTGTTGKLLGPLRTRAWGERWLTRVFGAAVASASYVVCVPWDLRNRAQVSGSTQETTPVTGVGVAALGVLLLLLAAYFGYRDRRGWPLLLIAVPPATLMYVSLSSQPGPPDGFANAWPLTWAFFALVIAAGVLVAAEVGRAYRVEEESTEGLVSAGQR